MSWLPLGDKERMYLLDCRGATHFVVIDAAGAAPIATTLSPDNAWQTDYQHRHHGRGSQYGP